MAVDRFDFSEALDRVKHGERLCRAGTSGAFIFLVPGSRFAVNRPPLLGIYPEGTLIDYDPHIDMKTADGPVSPWLASQADLLAIDWCLYQDDRAPAISTGFLDQAKRSPEFGPNFPEAAKRLPQYRSHKLVRAGPIIRFGDALAVIVSADGREEAIDAPPGTFSRGRPNDGDYLVVYEPDGYISWSPKAVFEAGNTRTRP